MTNPDDAQAEERAREVLAQQLDGYRPTRVFAAMLREKPEARLEGHYPTVIEFALKAMLALAQEARARENEACRSDLKSVKIDAGQNRSDYAEKMHQGANQALYMADRLIRSRLTENTAQDEGGFAQRAADVLFKAAETVREIAESIAKGK